MNWRGNGRGDAANRIPITISIMLATVMNSIDTTIANVALPHIQGSVSASADQITWVLTSYIVSAAIMTPLTGFIAGRFGRKQVFLVSIGGFTVASMLCGLADNLIEIVGFRFLQGLFGAALIPLSQAVILDIYPPEKQGQAMAMWGAGAVLGPVFGPVLGGWLTDALNWRWVFFINLPVGLLAMAGVGVFLSEKKASWQKPFDFLGFASLAVAIAAIQMVLDRGPGQDWLYSVEIQIYAVIFAAAIWVFAIQILTTKHPFIELSILRDFNFMMATLLGFFVGILMFATMALLPTLMQSLLGYPVAYSGIVSTPRGVGSFIGMMLVGQLIGRVNVRLILFTGLMITAYSMWMMTHFNLLMDSSPLEISGLLSGIGTGLVFVPLSTMAFSTIRNELRAEAAGFYTLTRNIGSSVGISIMQAYLVGSVAMSRSALVEGARPDNPVFQAYYRGSFDSAASLAALSGQINREALMLSYVNAFTVLLGLCLVCVPILFLLRGPAKVSREPDLHVAVE